VTQKTEGVITRIDTTFEPGHETEGTVTVAAGLPGKLKPYTMPAGSTWRDVLLKAELNADGQEIRVDNEPTDLDSPIREGQTLMLFRPVRGNTDDEGMVTVAAGLPGKLKPYTLPAGSTWRDVLLKAELNADGQEIRVDNEPTDLNAPIREGQTLMLFRPVRGN
jgi:sulfur carrier protein ThiS